MMPGHFNVQPMMQPVKDPYQPYPPYQNGMQLDSYAGVQMQVSAFSLCLVKLSSDL